MQKQDKVQLISSFNFKQLRTCQLVTRYSAQTFEPPRGKTNNVVSEQVRHKPACTVTEAG